MTLTEDISRMRGYQRLSVIAGVGVKEYYEKVLGYVKEGTYVIKELKD